MSVFGMEPNHKIYEHDDGRATIWVTPPGKLKYLGTSFVNLSLSQYERYKQWCKGEGLIQDCLQDVSPELREILLTGIDANKLGDT
jgi:hypothetical protein